MFPMSEERAVDGRVRSDPAIVTTVGHAVERDRGLGIDVLEACGPILFDLPLPGFDHIVVRMSESSLDAGSNMWSKNVVPNTGEKNSPTKA